MNLEELGKRVSRRGIFLIPPSTALFREKRTDEPDSGLMRNRRSAQQRRMSLPRPSAHLRRASTLEEGPSGCWQRSEVDQINALKLTTPGLFLAV
jgi:hypothetical protein